MIRHSRLGFKVFGYVYKVGPRNRELVEPNRTEPRTEKISKSRAGTEIDGSGSGLILIGSDLLLGSDPVLWFFCSSLASWFRWISFDYRVTLGLGSIAGGLDHANPIIRLPFERGINMVPGLGDHPNPNNIMDGINIDNLTIEQYLRLTLENETPSMVKKIDDMTIAEYIEYKERIKRQYNRKHGSYFPTYSGHFTSSNNTTIEFPRSAYFNPIQPNTEFNYDSEDMELDEEAGYTTDEESVMSEHEAINHAHTVNTQSFEEELSSKEDLDEWLKDEMEKHMSKQNKKNEEDALIAIIKSIREECRVVHKNKQISASEGADLKNLSRP
ncbi:hypothetical protein Tco_0221534 [Tanacetum coccineum]